MGITGGFGTTIDLARGTSRLADIIDRGHHRDGTHIGAAVAYTHGMQHDRLIVITDEQSADRVPDPAHVGRSYMINVAANRNGVGYGSWLHIDGWSEAVIDYLRVYEGQTE